MELHHCWGSLWKRCGLCAEYWWLFVWVKVFLITLNWVAAVFYFLMKKTLQWIEIECFSCRYYCWKSHSIHWKRFQTACVSIFQYLNVYFVFFCFLFFFLHFLEMLLNVDVVQIWSEVLLYSTIFFCFHKIWEIWGKRFDCESPAWNMSVYIYHNRCLVARTLHTCICLLIFSEHLLV